MAAATCVELYYYYYTCFELPRIGWWGVLQRRHSLQKRQRGAHPQLEPC